MTAAHLPVSGQGVQRLKEKVLARRPVLADILRKRGEKTLHEYVQDYLDINSNGVIQKRQRELLITVRNELVRLYGREVALPAIAQLRKYGVMSTADHAGPLTHPYFVNSNLAFAIAVAEKHDPNLRYIISLAGASITMSNDSYPKGLLLHGMQQGNPQFLRVPFQSRKYHDVPVHTVPPYGGPAVHHARAMVDTFARDHLITDQQRDHLRHVLDTIYGRADILAQKSYTDQTLITNHLLWQEWWAKSARPVPTLLQLEFHTLVAQLLIQYHLGRDTILRHFILDPSYRSYIQQYFDGIMGSFSSSNQTGTHLFWAVPPGKNCRVQLTAWGDKLTTPDGSYQLPLEAEAIKNALEKKEIIPNLVLSFAVLSFYYGIKCLGGFNQVNYLTQMKKAFLRMQIELNNYRSIEACARVQTKEMNDGLTLAYLRTKDNELLPATGIDLLLYGNTQSWDNIVSTTKKMTFADAFYPLLPELYRIMYLETEREPVLASITSEQIDAAVGLASKVVPAAQL